MIRLAWSVFLGDRFRWVRGSQHKPILYRVRDGHAEFGRGGVLVLGPVMVWWLFPVGRRLRL